MGGDRIAGLQALRGVAAILVFVHHLPWITGTVVAGRQSLIKDMHLGSAGVFLFFVLSGYLMAYKVAGSPGKFALGRLRRIFPGFWAAVVLSAALQSWMGNAFEISPYLLVLYPTGKVLTTAVPYWTLSFELAFYVLLGASIVLYRERALVVVGAVLVVSYALATRPYTWRIVAYAGWYDLAFSLFSVFFLVGIVLGRLPAIQDGRVAVGMAIVGACLLAGQNFVAAIDAPWLFPTVFWRSGTLPLLLSAVGAGLVVWAALAWRPGGFFGRVLSAAGNASYGIYLMHIAFMQLTAFGLKQLGFSDWPYYSVMAMLALPSFALAYAFGRMEWRLQGLLKQVAAAPSQKLLSRVVIECVAAHRLYRRTRPRPLNHSIVCTKASTDSQS